MFAVDDVEEDDDDDANRLVTNAFVQFMQEHGCACELRLDLKMYVEGVEIGGTCRDCIICRIRSIVFEKWIM